MSSTKFAKNALYCPMPIEFVQILIAVISLMLFLHVYWIQAGSNSLISMMNLEQKVNLNEFEIGGATTKLKRETAVDAFSFLNLVAKLYLNHSINISMLRTFEGAMFKLMSDKRAQKIYADIFIEFKDEHNAAEPPFINLVYAVDVLKNCNSILRKKTFLAPVHVRIYLLYKYIYFRWQSHSAKNWQLAEKVFSKSSK